MGIVFCLPTAFQRRRESRVIQLCVGKEAFVMHSDSKATSSTTVQYEGILGDMLPCPSCEGSGLIPKERERELIALIPFSDGRLKPRWRIRVLWLVLGLLGALLVCGLVTFFLFPRSIQAVQSSSGRIRSAGILNYTKERRLDLVFEPSLRVSSSNFYPVRVERLNATATILRPYASHSSNVIVGTASSSTPVMIPIRSRGVHIPLNFTIAIFDKGIISICRTYPLYGWLTLSLEWDIEFSLLSTSEEKSLTSQVDVCCGVLPFATRTNCSLT